MGPDLRPHAHAARDPQPQLPGDLPGRHPRRYRAEDAAHLFHQDQLREGRINFLLHGILYADGIVTVSPTYAREIQGEELGAGLDPFLRVRSSTVVGILNGVDYAEWSPERDPLIPARYTAADRSGNRSTGRRRSKSHKIVP